MRHYKGSTMEMHRCIYVSVIAVAIIAANPVKAQHPTGEFRELSVEVGPMSDPSSLVEQPRLVPRRIPRDIPLTDRLRLIDRPVVVMPDRKGIRLPLKLNFMTSLDRDTIMQFGDALMRMHPVRTDLFWIGKDGKVRAEVRDRFDGDAMLDMSGDGYVAVVGRPFLSKIPHDQPATKDVVIYNSDAKVVMKGEIDPDTEVSAILSLPRGSGALMAVGSAKDPLADNRLLVLRNGVLRQIGDQRFGILQKIVDLYRDELVFVQGSEAYGLVDAAEAQVIWLKPGGIRLIGRSAAALTPSGDRLLLMTGVRVGGAAEYDWMVSVLNARSGRGLGRQPISGVFPGTNEPVFTDLTPESATIGPGGRKKRISIRPR